MLRKHLMRCNIFGDINLNLDLEETSVNTGKVLHGKLTCSIFLKKKKVEAFQDLDPEKGDSLPPLLFNIIMKVSARAIRQGKEVNRCELVRRKSNYLSA